MLTKLMKEKDPQKYQLLIFDNDFGDRLNQTLDLQKYVLILNFGIFKFH